MPPVKVVHFADVHLGVENYGRFDPDTGLSRRLTDFLRSIDRVIDTALEEEADLVVFAGDAYKTRDPSPTYQREFARRIRRLSQAGTPTVLVAGNHDVPNAVGRAHTMEIFATLDVESVYVSRRPELFDIETHHGPVQVGALPWMVRSGLLARHEHKNRSLEDVTKVLLDRIEEILCGQDGIAGRLSPDVPHVLVAHGTVQGAVYSSERTVMLGQEIVLPLSLVKNEHWDYVALGHIHRHQAIGADRAPPVVYPGSVERIDFGEEREAKGFVIACVEPGGCSWEFRELATRPFVTIRVAAEGQDPTQEILDEIGRTSIDGAVVRLIIRTTPECGVLIRENEVRGALTDAFYVSGIVHNVVRPERIRFGDQGEVSTLTPLEALDRYLQAKEVLPERREVLKEHAELLWASGG